MVSNEVEAETFEYTDGQDINFIKSVANGNVEKEDVVDFLEDHFPEESFTDEDIEKVKEYIIDYAKYNLTSIILEIQRNFENDLNNMLVYYESEEGLDRLNMCKILIDKANNLFPNV